MSTNVISVYIVPLVQIFAILLVVWQIYLQNRSLRKQAESLHLQTDIKAVDLIQDYTEMLYGSGLHRLFQDLNYNREWLPDVVAFDSTVGKGCGEEARLAREGDLNLAHVLDLINSVCYAIHNKLIPESAICNTILGYMIANCWAHPGIQEYLRWVDGDHLIGGRHQRKAFGYFRKYAPEIVDAMYPAGGAGDAGSATS